MKKGTKLSLENILQYIEDIKNMDIESAKVHRLIPTSTTHQEWVDKKNRIIMGTSFVPKLLDNVKEINEKGLLTPKLRKLSPNLLYLVTYVENVLDVLPITRTLISDIELKKLADMETKFLVSLERFAIVGNIAHTFTISYQAVFDMITEKMADFNPSDETFDERDRNKAKVSTPLTKTSTIVRWITLFSDQYYTYCISNKGFGSASKFRKSLEKAITESRFEAFFEAIHIAVKSAKLADVIIQKHDNAGRPSSTEVVKKLREGKRGNKKTAEGEEKKPKTPKSVTPAFKPRAAGESYDV